MMLPSNSPSSPDFDAMARADAIANTEPYRNSPPLPNESMWRSLDQFGFTRTVFLTEVIVNNLRRQTGMSADEVRHTITESWEIARMRGAVRYDEAWGQVKFPFITPLQPTGEAIELGIRTNSLLSPERPQPYALTWVYIPEEWANERLKIARESLTDELISNMRRASLRRFGTDEILRSDFANFIKNEFGFDYNLAGFIKVSELIDSLDWVQEVPHDGVVDLPLRIVMGPYDVLPQRVAPEIPSVVQSDRVLGNMLAEAFKRSPDDCEYDAQIVQTIISRYSHELYGAWLREKQPSPGHVVPKLADFLDRIVAASQDSRLGRLYTPFQSSAAIATYYYSSGESPSRKLLGIVANCISIACQVESRSITELMRTREMGQLLRELSQHFGGQNVLAERIISIRPSLRGRLMVPGVGDSKSLLDSRTVGQDTVRDDWIPEYPPYAMVKVGSTESVQELTVLAREVQCEPFDNYVPTLCEICGYAGRSPDVWRAIFAHDWRSSAVPIGERRAYWRSANLCDTSGCQLFALLEELPDGRYRLDRFCTVDDMQRITGRREARPPRPNYHRYDWLQYRLSHAAQAWESLRESGASVSIAKRLEEGRQPSEDERRSFEEYVRSWDQLRMQITAFGMESELGIPIASSSIADLKERIDDAMSSEDVRARWIELLREVVLGCAECFKRATIFGYPPKFDQDLEAISDAGSHYERMVDTLQTMTDRYKEIVELFEAGQSYDECGEALTRTEDYLGVETLQPVFTQLCKQFSEANMRISELSAARRNAMNEPAPTSADDGLLGGSAAESFPTLHTRLDTEDDIPSPLPATPLHGSPVVAPVRRDEQVISLGADTGWQPPSIDAMRTSAIPASEVTERVTTSASEAASKVEVVPVKYSSRELVIDGYEGSYESGRESGLVSFDCPVRPLVSVGALGTQGAGPNERLLNLVYGVGSCPIGTLIAVVREAIDDRVRPDMLYRIFEGFEEPSVDDATQDELFQYYLLRAVSERLRMASGSGSADGLYLWSYYLAEAIDPAQPLDDADAIAICEVALRLAMTLDESCLDLSERLYGLVGQLGTTGAEKVAAIKVAAVDNYLTSYDLARELDRRFVDKELEEIANYARMMGPGSYNDRYPGVTHLWNWLMGPECDDRFVRVRNMVAAMADQSVSYDVTWCFADENEALEFLDKSYEVHTAVRGRPKEDIVGSPRRKFSAQIMEISRRFEHYVSLASLGRAYVNPLYESIADNVLAVVDQLKKTVDGCRESMLLTLVKGLLGSFPIDRLPWREEGAYDLYEPASEVSPAALSFVELQKHRRDADAANYLTLEALPSADELWRKASLALRAYANNVIGASERDGYRETFARVLGVSEYLSYSQSDDASGKVLWATWAYECACKRLEASLARTFREFRVAIRSRIDDPRRPEDAYKSWLRDMLAKLDQAERPEEVLAFGDFLMEANVAAPEVPTLDAGDILYGSGLRRGLHDLIRSDLVGQGGFYPTPRLAGIAKDIKSDDIQPVRDCLQRIANLVDTSPVPANGKARTLNARAEGFLALAEKLFRRLGFAEPLVAPLVENGEVRRFVLNFLAHPGARMPDGSLICPLAQLVSMEPDTRAPGRNACLLLELYTTYDALVEACRRDQVSEGRRIALYLGTDDQAMGDRRMLTLDDRVRLASRVCEGEEGSGFLLLDEVLIAYLLHYEGGSERLGVFFRCTAQFTKLHPYADRGLPANERAVSSDESRIAPNDRPPLFYGRRKALERIMSFGVGGAYIVCGARRMGKTSLLREAAAILQANRAAMVGGIKPDPSIDSTTVAVYCDLRGHTGGSVDDFWVNYVKYYTLKTLPGEIEGLAEATEAREVIAALTNFMHEGGWRIILMLDEADDMLVHDSRVIEDRGPETSILDSLAALARDEASFKFILSGLHVTMRYSNGLPNKVTAFMGQPIEVAPLWEDGGYIEAYKLVYEPMKAMGMRLDHQSVLTIISRAGYYPNLINQVMEMLLERVRRRRDLWKLDDGLCVDVPNHLVESVFDDFDRVLRGNFNDTIAVDRVYGAIVYAIAFLSYEDEVHDWAPVSIAKINDVLISKCRDLELNVELGNVETYLDELTKIRVLRCEERRYTVRDAEIRVLLRMNGLEWLREQFARALNEWASAHSSTYHPELAREVMDRQPNGTPMLASLNREQALRIREALDVWGVCLIRGSDLSGLDRLVRQLEVQPYALLPNYEGWIVQIVDSLDETGLSSDDEDPDGKRLWVLRDGWDVEDFDFARGRAQLDPTLRFLFLAGPSRSWELLVTEELGTGSDAYTIDLHSWEEQNLRQWLKSVCDYDSDDMVNAVSRATGSLSGLLGRMDTGLLAVGQVEEARSRLVDTGLLTEDLAGAIRGYPILQKTVQALSENGEDESLRVSEWYELLGVECSMREFCYALSWCLLMGMADRDDGQYGTEALPDTQVHASAWLQGIRIGEGGCDD